MTDDLHALIHRLADELDCYWQMLTDDRTAQHPLAIEAHAALARWGRPTPPPPNDLSHLSEAEFQALCPQGYHGVGDEPVEPEPEGPTDEELDELAWNWYSKTGSTWYQIEAFRAFARAVLARWGRPAPSPAADEPAVPEGREPASVEQQAAGGEVVELVAWLLEEAVQAADADQPRAAGMLTRAAELLGGAQLAEPESEGPTKTELRQVFDAQSGYILDEQVMWWSDFLAATRAALARWGRPTPQPIPVSERLPGPGDCDAEGLCWVWHATAYTWGLFRLDLTAHSHWLSAHALPMPDDQG